MKIFSFLKDVSQYYYFSQSILNTMMYEEVGNKVCNDLIKATCNNIAAILTAYKYNPAKWVAATPFKLPRSDIL